ncbi:hypothetical protein Taro_049179 [Colocasia esculenta]|uniref:Uncharacterized protein n=1 Tax=Colocasia esculenta TaxID=4460 RepID=A0A843XA75_COLES|nr:hypothetical protein [Colocasia esculenta]
MGLQLLAETPLEALVFLQPAISGGSLWTWLAVIAAVLGLWRIRSAAAAPRTECPLSPTGHVVPAHDNRGSDFPQMKAVPQKQQQPESEARFPTIAVDDSGSVGFARKGAVFKLRRCRVEEAAEENDDGSVEEEVTAPVEEEECRWNEDRGTAGGFVEGRWKGDLGWYQHQDLAAFNGRVVKLWEDEKRVAASPLRQRRLQSLVG